MMSLPELPVSLFFLQSLENFLRSMVLFQIHPKGTQTSSRLKAGLWGQIEDFLLDLSLNLAHP